MDMKDVRVRGPEHVGECFIHHRRPISICKAVTLPVVHDLDDRQTFVNSPRHRPVRACGIEFRTDDRHEMTSRKLATQLERVQLRASAVAGEKIVNRVNESHYPAISGAASW